MNEHATVTRRGGRQLVELPDGIDLAADRVQVRIVGDTIVLGPIGEWAVAPGSYTPDTLPPLSEGAKAILASSDAVAPLVDMRSARNGRREAPGITLEDEGITGVRLSDEGLPGIDPDN